MNSSLILAVVGIHRNSEIELPQVLAQVIQRAELAWTPKMGMGDVAVAITNWTLLHPAQLWVQYHCVA